MDLGELFGIRWKKESEEDRKNYERKIFPYGPEQKEYLFQLIRDHLKPQKASLEDCCYMYVTYRQLLAEEHGDDAYAEWYHSVIGKILSHEEKAFIRALGDLDLQTESPDHLVSAEDVITLAKDYAKEDRPARPGLFKGKLFRKHK